MTKQVYKRKLNQVHILPSTQKWLVEKANTKGELVGDYAGLVLDDLAEGDPMDEYDPDKSETDIWHNRWFERRGSRWERLKIAAAIYSSDPTSEGERRLRIMCKLAEKSFEDVTIEATKDPFTRLAIETRNATKKTQCITWLYKFLTQHGGCVESSIVYAAAELKGFSSSTLERAKQTIRMDVESPSIESEREDGKPVWVLVGVTSSA